MACPEADRSGWGRIGRRSALLAVAAGLAFALAPARAADEVDVAEVARRIARQGPRVPGSAPHQRVVEILLAALDHAGLSEVEARRFPGDPELVLVTGLLPGEAAGEILLTAHFDTVEGSPGAADNAAGCAVIIAAAAHLAEIPRRRTVRVLLFDGEERGGLGSSAWVRSLDAEQKNAILAAINVDLIAWDENRRGTVLPLLSSGDSTPRVAPGWLVHAIVKSSRAVGAPLAVASVTASPLGQLLLRSLRLRIASDADVLLGHGIPALTLSDADAFSSDEENHTSRDVAARLNAVALERWVARVSASVRRLDVLAGRPRDDDQYLALFGRVWSRRELYWLALAVWVLLVFQGLPGRWRAAGSTERRRRGRDYLPGFAMRLLLLACIMLLPVFTVVLLLPAALVAALPIGWRPGLRPAIAIAVAPALLTLVALVVMTAQGQVEGFGLSPVAALLLGACLVAQLAWIGRTSRVVAAVAPP